MPFNKKSVLALWGAGALLFSMSALANNPAPPISAVRIRPSAS